MLKITNFAVISEKEKALLEKSGSVNHFGAALGIEKDPTESEMVQIVSTEQPEILIVNSAPVTTKVVDAMNNVKLIICARGNPINVDVKYCLSKGIPVTHTPGRNANGVAEYTICMMIAALRKIPQAINSIFGKECTLNYSVDELKNRTKDIAWMHPEIPYEPYYEFTGNEIMGKTLGLVGFGFIGQKVAQKAAALGMELITYDPYINEEILKKYEVKSVSLEKLLQTADVISLHAKASDEYLITKESFKLMKDTSIIINTARSSLMDTDALLDALRNKQIRAAVLDVFEYEPLSNFDPMVAEKIEGLILTPHIGGATEEVADHQSKMVLEAILAYIKKAPLPYQAK